MLDDGADEQSLRGCQLFLGKKSKHQRGSLLVSSLSNKLICMLKSRGPKSDSRAQIAVEAAGIYFEISGGSCDDRDYLG